MKSSTERECRMAMSSMVEGGSGGNGPMVAGASVAKEIYRVRVPDRNETCGGE